LTMQSSRIRLTSMQQYKQYNKNKESGDHIIWPPNFFRKALLLISILFIGLIYYVIASNNIFIIPCAFRFITGFFFDGGLRCPVCGITHMIVSELKLDFVKAFESNQVIFVLQPFLLYEVIKLIWCYIFNKKAKYSKLENIFIIACIVVLLIFGIVRNITERTVGIANTNTIMRAI